MLVQVLVRRFGRVLLLAVMVLAGACQDSAAPQLPPTAAPPQFVLVPDVLADRTDPSQGALTLAGFVVSQKDGVALASALVFDTDGGGYVSSTAAAPIWLGADFAKLGSVQLQTAGTLQYAPALVRGALQGPGEYGPGDHYMYQISAPKLEAWVPVESSVGALLDDPQSYNGRLVRVLGSLLLGKGSALLVDKLGSGGIPAQGARQIKLLGPIDDSRILNALTESSSGVVRFGQVQVEGVLRGTVLVPLALRPVR